MSLLTAGHQNWKAHVRWTGPQIHSQLPEISVLCAGMGTSGRHPVFLFLVNISLSFERMSNSVL